MCLNHIETLLIINTKLMLIMLLLVASVINNEHNCLFFVYYCVFIAILFRVLCFQNLFVLVPPEMLAQGVITSEPVGKNVVLKCIVKSYLPLTSLIWCNEHREHVLMDTKSSNVFSRKGIKPVMFETYLEYESETYKCVASNIIGSVESKPVQVYGSRHEGKHFF